MATKRSHAGRRDRALWDRWINDQWGGQQPVLSPEESLTAARKLYRHATGKAWPGKWELTSGNRYTWPRYSVFRVNPDKREGHTRGLRSIIHDVSHYCHYRLHRGDSPHSIRQARLEKKLTKFALDRKWHEGALRKEAKPVAEAKAKPDLVAQRYARLVARRDKWKRELDRAKRLLAKAESETRAYQRKHRERLM